MAYRLALSLKVLRDELNTVYVVRDTESDGWVGDADHASRQSDHNPWIKDDKGVGVVRALDIDEDLDGDKRDTGADALWLAEYLRALGKMGDPRLTGGGYVIYDGKIASEKSAWEWRPYTGVNAHKKHVHLSVSRSQSGYDDQSPWGVIPRAPEGNEFLSALTEDEQKDAYRILRKLEDDYLVPGRGVRQVIVEVAQRTKDLVSGKRPGR